MSSGSVLSPVCQKRQISRSYKGSTSSHRNRISRTVLGHICSKTASRLVRALSTSSPFQRENIIRVGGRLRHSALTYHKTHPILLLADHVISELIAKNSHHRVFHSGCERTLCEIRRRFWIVRGRHLVRKILRNCATCRKLRQYPYTTIMGHLPPEKLKLFSSPFSVTNLSLFGPFHLKYGRNKMVKAWGAVFTCTTVRAIHLEIVQHLSWDIFRQS